MQFLNKWLFKSTLFKQSIKCALSFNLWNNKLKWHFFSVLQNNIIVASVEYTIWLSETFWSWVKNLGFLKQVYCSTSFILLFKKKKEDLDIIYSGNKCPRVFNKRNQGCSFCPTGLKKSNSFFANRVIHWAQLDQKVTSFVSVFSLKPPPGSSRLALLCLD